MKISRSTAKQLSKFRVLADEIIFTPTSRFYAFGQGKNRMHQGIVAEGRIVEKLDDFKVVRPPSHVDSKLPTSRTLGFAIAKVKGFNNAVNRGSEIASFSIDINTMKSIVKTGRGNKRTHVRFCRKKADQIAFARSFDARKYFSELIEESKETNAYDQFLLTNLHGSDFFKYVKMSTFKLIDKDDYEVSILSNGILIFTGMNNDLTYYCRDQALGHSFEEEIANPIMRDTVLLLHPKRGEAVRHSIQS